MTPAISLLLYVFGLFQRYSKINQDYEVNEILDNDWLSLARFKH